MLVAPAVVPFAVHPAVGLHGLAVLGVLEDVVDVGVGHRLVAGVVVAFAVADLDGAAGGTGEEPVAFPAAPSFAPFRPYIKPTMVDLISAPISSGDDTALSKRRSYDQPA